MNDRKQKLITWLFFVPQLYMFFQFSNYTSYGYLIVFLLAFPLYLLTGLFAKYISCSLGRGLRRFAKDTIILFALSVLIYLSVFVKWVDTNYFESFVLMFSRLSFIFVFTYTFSNYLLQASFKKHENKTKRYMLIVYAVPSLIVFALVWLAGYPAIMSPDSVYIWTEAVRNTYDNSHPLLYVMSVKLLSLIWQAPQTIIIFHILLTSFTFSYSVYRMRTWGLNKYACLFLAFVFPILPVNAIFTVTMWKDIPYTMGLILISLELIRALRQKDYFGKKINIAFFAVLLLFVMVTRHNAPYVIAFSMAVYIIILLKRKMKKESLIMAVVTVGSIAVFIASMAVTKAALGDKYTGRDATSAFYALPLQGIMAAYHDAPGEVTPAQKEKMDKYFNMDQLEMHYIEFQENERWRNFSRTGLIVDKEAVKDDKFGILGLYAEFFVQNPVIVLRSYFNQTSIIWCSRDTSYVSGMPWYIAHFEGFEDINSDSKFPWLSEQINAFLASNPKGIRGFFEHPASMMMLILILAYVGIKKKGIKAVVFILPALLNSLGYMATIEGQCTRYTYINYTIAMVYFAYILLDEQKNVPEAQASLK